MLAFQCSKGIPVSCSRRRPRHSSAPPGPLACRDRQASTRVRRGRAVPAARDMRPVGETRRVAVDPEPPGRRPAPAMTPCRGPADRRPAVPAASGRPQRRSGERRVADVERRCAARSRPSATASRAGPARQVAVGDAAAGRRARARSTPVDHLAGPQQHRRGLALGPADDVDAPVHAVGEVDVQRARAGRTSPRCAASGRGRRASRVVARPGVRLDLGEPDARPPSRASSDGSRAGRGATSSTGPVEEPRAAASRPAAAQPLGQAAGRRRSPQRGELLGDPVRARCRRAPCGRRGRPRTESTSRTSGVRCGETSASSSSVTSSRSQPWTVHQTTRWPTTSCASRNGTPVRTSQLGDVGGEREARRRGRGQPVGVDASSWRSCPASAGSTSSSVSTASKHRLLVLLQVAVVGQRQALEHGQQRRSGRR